MVTVCAIFVAVPLSAQQTTYSFDTVKALNLGKFSSSVTGIQKDTGADLTVTFSDYNAALAMQFPVNRCVPIFLTAIEKPGRYFLYVTVDPSDLHAQLISCQLELKP
jgi:hypothetical protein